MKCHTTNYCNTFIAIADDCPVKKGEVPPIKGDNRTIANIQFDLIRENPYRFSSDDILLHIFIERNDIDKNLFESTKEQFFSKGQACLRSSPLTKRYGWGLHFDKNSKVASYGCETDEYRDFICNPKLTILKAMKSKK
jgi:Family of unknown function (DUF6157)